MPTTPTFAIVGAGLGHRLGVVGPRAGQPADNHVGVADGLPTCWGLSWALCGVKSTMPANSTV
jgi:hypothetical protein